MGKGAISASGCIQMGQNGWSPWSRFVILWHCSLYRACAKGYDSYACIEPVERRGSYTETSRYWTTQCDHSTGWPPSCSCGHDGPYSFIHSVESTLEYCNRFGPVCFNSLLPCLRAGLVAHIPLHRLLLTKDHQCLRLQWTCECRHWHAEWLNVVFSDESFFNMSYNAGSIHVWRYTGERNLRACILQCGIEDQRQV